jgi:hypothetical protein
MDVFGVEKEFDWLVKILKSSNSMSHVEMCDKLLSFFIKKWDGIVNEDQKITFCYDFESKKVKVIQKLEKKHSIM